MDTWIVKIEEDSIDQTVLVRAGEIIKKRRSCGIPHRNGVRAWRGRFKRNVLPENLCGKRKTFRQSADCPLAQMEDLPKIARDIPKQALALAGKYWPGPLTMIFNKTECVPPETTGGLSTVAVRMPSNKIARALIEASGGYVAAPSANRSGRPSPTLAKYVAEDLDGRVDMIIDGGAAEIGLESTIVDFTEEIP